MIFCFKIVAGLTGGERAARVHVFTAKTSRGHVRARCDAVSNARHFSPLRPALTLENTRFLHEITYKVFREKNASAAAPRAAAAPFSVHRRGHILLMVKLSWEFRSNGRRGWTALGGAGKKDPKRGFDLCLKGALAGETKAAARVGELYFAGVGTVKNLKEAYKWLKKAGDKQDPSAAYNLGLMHLNGDGVAKSVDKARRWLTVSALQRHRIAFEPVARLYRNRVIELLKNEQIDVRMTRWAIFFLNLARSIQTSSKQRSNYAALIDQFSELSPKARRLADQDLSKWNDSKF